MPKSTLYLSDVHVGDVRQKIVAHEKTHQDPVVNNLLNIILKWKLVLQQNRHTPKYHSVELMGL